MQHNTEIAQKEIEYKGFWFNSNTPIEIMELICSLHKSKTRIVLDLGDTEGDKIGQSWGECCDISGTIGKSTGIKPIPLLIHNSRSMGGGRILTHRIVKVIESKGKKVLYQHKNFQAYKEN